MTEDGEPRETETVEMRIVEGGVFRRFFRWLRHGKTGEVRAYTVRYPNRFAPHWRDRLKWWFLFLTFNEPEQIHRALVLENLDSTSPGEYGGLVKFTVLEASAVFIFPMTIMAVCVYLTYTYCPSLLFLSIPFSMLIGMLTWLEALHISKDLPTEPVELKFRTKAIWNTTLRLWVCPRCLFPLSSNGGVCKVCGAEILPDND